MFSCKYGHFSNDGYEYIIVDPKTPMPWSNIISNGEYSILVTQTGSGYSWGKNSIENRVTRFIQDYIQDDCGKYFYIRDDETGELWGFTYKPMDKCGDDYKVTHGIGYSIFSHTYSGIRSTLRVSLSKEDMVEFYYISLENISGRKRSISIFSYVELHLGHYPEENREFDKLFMRTSYMHDSNSILCRKTFWGIMGKDGICNNQEYKYLFFMSSTREIVSYETSKENFIGMYESLKTPSALKGKTLLNTSGENMHAIASIQLCFDIENESMQDCYVYMGICKEEEFNNTICKYRTHEEIIKESSDFEKYIRNLIDEEHIITEDKSIDIMVNIWCKYQTIMCRFFGKASYYQTNKGIGFRDHIQDSMIFLTSDKDIIKNQILKQASMQFINGSTPHFLLDESMSCINTNSSDDHLWLLYVFTIYINETYDLDILIKKVPYIDSHIEEDIYTHMKKCIIYSLNNLSDLYLCNILKHDWNDSISNFHGESVFISELLYTVMKEFRSICELVGDIDFIQIIDRYIRLIEVSVNVLCYNGEYFLRCVSKDLILGDKLGDGGEIFLIPQAFGVISDICDDERKFKIMDNVYKYLNTEFGLKILHPPYRFPNKNIGYITRYAKGVRENGSIYYHACMWGILAFILIGDINKAQDIIDKINPINKVGCIDIYKLEPYVMPSSVEGDYSESFGRGNWSFNTGSSVWFHRIITNFVIGVRGTLRGLLIDPKPFVSWNNFFIRRKFRGAIFNIYFKRNGNKQILIYVDGIKIHSNIITNIENNRIYDVRVFL